MQGRLKNRRVRQQRQTGGLTKQQQIAKDTDNLKQLLQMPDFQVIDFFQTLSRSPSQQQVLNHIPTQSKIRFFSDRFPTFLSTQQQLMTLQLPQLDQIPKIKELQFLRSKNENKQQNFDQSTVLQLIDSFSSAVADQNTQQIHKIYNMIQEMKKHQKYRKYFQNYSTNKILLQNYNFLLENCNSLPTLQLVGETEAAMHFYMESKTEDILQRIRTNLNVSDSGVSLGKETGTLVQSMHREIATFKRVFSKSETLDVHVTQWMLKVVKQYYQLVQPYIYSKEELADILSALGIMIERAADMESKGVCLQRQFKELIAQDLPSHIAKIIEIIVETINVVLRDDDRLYQFIYIKSVHSFAMELEKLKLVDKKDYSKKCASNKGIILVNSFILILSSLCDQKWAFLHQSVVNILIEKIALNILASSLLMWDYYHVYTFFDRLSQGRVQHLIFYQGEIAEGLKEKIQRIKRLSQESWKLFQQNIMNTFWKEVLIYLPNMMWNFKKYSQLQSASEMRPTSFSLQTVFRIQDYLKQIMHRISAVQLQHIGVLFYDFFMYVVEYVLYWNYHSKGTNQKIFYLNKKNEKEYNKIKAYAIEDIFNDKQKILKLSCFTAHGLTRFAFEIHFITEAMKIHGLNLQAGKYLSRVAQIFAKEQGTQPLKLQKEQFIKPLQKLVELYRTKPQTMRNFVNDKRKSFNET